MIPIGILEMDLNYLIDFDVDDDFREEQKTVFALYMNDSSSGRARDCNDRNWRGGCQTTILGSHPLCICQVTFD